jgi:D-glycero-alpha-D-manno-heptose-7-phosphate kinase
MIMTRSPLRISLGGGGTDLPSYYREHTGFVISAAIDKYVYITLNEAFTPQIILKYSRLEHVERVDQIQHPIIREALKLTGVSGPNLEIVSISDIPAGTGLGSSGTFTTALLRALHTLNRNNVTSQELAEQACHIEMNLLREPVGKQDQYIAAFGGIVCFHFLPDDRVEVEPLQLPSDVCANLEDSLALFFTGYTRSASQILEDQDRRSKEKDGEVIANLDYIKSLGYQSKEMLQKGHLRCFGELMHAHWEHKKRRCRAMTNPEIDELYNLGRRHGAVGGKLIGAGGGGFLMFYTEDRTRLRKAMRDAGLREVRIHFDFAGATVLGHS